MNSDWPALPLDAWRTTYETLHLWMQIVGKICLQLAPPANHYWNVAFRVDPRGLVTPLLPYENRPFGFRFNFNDHRLEIWCCDGGSRQIPLQPMTVAEFYNQVMGELAEMGIHIKIWTMPVEIANPIRFTEDTVHRDYDPEYAHAFWRVLVTINPILETFRSEFVGKCSPVHFFWGGFDVAVTRFSGRAAPSRPERGAMYAEAYSHEVISHGFWPGSGSVQEAAFYAYAAPQPEHFPEAAVEPADAHYVQDMGLYVLPYEAVRTADYPENELRSFLQTTYDAAATLAGWKRGELERRH